LQAIAIEDPSPYPLPEYRMGIYTNLPGIVER
jgi:hypothetical protein